MRILFVRHGHPNYRDDCLTELGHLHAEAAAQRLKDEPIDAIFSSTCGRARETAEHIARPHGLAVTSYDFIREVSWGGRDGTELPYTGHPWDTADHMAAEGRTLMSTTWAEEPPFQNNRVVDEYERLSRDIDQWIATLGYTREGEFYRAGKVPHETVVMVSHGGASSIVLSHLFNLPFPFVCEAICPNFTAITVVSFGGKEGDLVSPRFELLNDARHIYGLEAKLKYDN